MFYRERKLEPSQYPQVLRFWCYAAACICIEKEYTKLSYREEEQLPLFLCLDAQKLQESLRNIGGVLDEIPALEYGLFG
ncbi:hypothetical protein LWI28_026359 [Acer negundo]|uniref:Uncharacterized protein n=1 Tax=Acer negundo TaxID=4023 RepID=A0AAD5JV68_ACENE|nr:hypothetical protein LWI28_026359 [Acer negundo]